MTGEELKQLRTGDRVERRVGREVKRGKVGRVWHMVVHIHWDDGTQTRVGWKSRIGRAQAVYLSKVTT